MVSVAPSKIVSWLTIDALGDTAVKRKVFATKPAGPSSVVSTLLVRKSINPRMALQIDGLGSRMAVIVLVRNIFGLLGSGVLAPTTMPTVRDAALESVLAQGVLKLPFASVIITPGGLRGAGGSPIKISISVFGGHPLPVKVVVITPLLSLSKLGMAAASFTIVKMTMITATIKE